MPEPTRIRSFIRCYGLFWNANEVDWYPGGGSNDRFRLLGRIGQNKSKLVSLVTRASEADSVDTARIVTLVRGIASRGSGSNMRWQVHCQTARANSARCLNAC